MCLIVPALHFFFPFIFVVGLYYCFSNLSDARIFIIMYGVTSMYFSAVMVRNALSPGAPFRLDSGGFLLPPAREDSVLECPQSWCTFPSWPWGLSSSPGTGGCSAAAVQRLPSEHLRSCVVKLLTVVDLSREGTGYSHFLIVRPTFLGFVPLCQGEALCRFLPPSSWSLKKGDDVFFLKAWVLSARLLKEKRDFIYCS